MPVNFPGPFEVRLFYTTGEPTVIRDHVLRLSCRMNIMGNPGDPFGAWIPVQKDGSAVVNLQTHVDSLVTALKPVFSTATDFSFAELWEYVPDSFDAVYRSVYDVNQSGTSTTASGEASQTIISFRTTLGGVAKLDLRGTVLSPGAMQSFPTSVPAVNTLATYMLDNSRIWIGRDGGYLLAAIKYLPGQNERAWRRVNR